MKTKTNKILAYIMTVCMLAGVFSGLSVTAIAADPITVTSSHYNSNTDDGIVLAKKSELKEDGTVDISIGAYTTGEVVVQSSNIPTDIVLVLDVSGSMNDTMNSSSIVEYLPVTGSERSTYFLV